MSERFHTEATEAGYALVRAHGQAKVREAELLARVAALETALEEAMILVQAAHHYYPKDTPMSDSMGDWLAAHAALRNSHPTSAEPDTTAVLHGLPPELARVLRDQSVIVPQDAAVFDLIASWAKAPSNTASAEAAYQAAVDDPEAPQGRIAMAERDLAEARKERDEAWSSDRHAFCRQRIAELEADAAEEEQIVRLCHRDIGRLKARVAALETALRGVDNFLTVVQGDNVPRGESCKLQARAIARAALAAPAPAEETFLSRPPSKRATHLDKVPGEPFVIEPAGWVCWYGSGPYATRREALRCECPKCEAGKRVAAKKHAEWERDLELADEAAGS